MKPEIYVVRIYRRTRDQPRRILGVVEATDTERRAHFASLADLAAILGAPRTHLRRSAPTSTDPSKARKKPPSGMSNGPTATGDHGEAPRRIAVSSR